MKRGTLGILLLFSLLFIPFVSAATNDVLDIFIGSSDSSMVFLRFMYGALIFLIFVFVSKKAIFKSSDTSGHDKNSAKLANMFSLILAIFATRFTPEPVVQNFGWVIMVLTPLIIYYFLFGIFTRKKPSESTDKELNFSWTRFILAAIATLFTLSALGKSNYLGGFPFIGGGLNELFFDVNYLLFDKYLPFLLLLIPLAIIIALLSKFGFGKSSSSGTSSDLNIPGWLILGALLILLLFLLGSLVGGFGIPGLGNLSWLIYVLLAIAAIILLILLVRFWPVLGPYLSRFWNWLKGLFSRIPGMTGPSSRIRIDLIANGVTASSIDPSMLRRTLYAEPNLNLPIQVIVSQRSWLWFNKRLPGVKLNFSVSPGTCTITPTATTDPSGAAPIIFRGPQCTATLSIAIDPNPAISGAYNPPKFTIKVQPNSLPKNICVELITSSRTVSSNGPTTRALLAEPNLPLPITVRVSRRRRFLRNVRLDGATVNLIVNTGTIAPVTLITNANGEAPTTFNPPATNATANLDVAVSHPSISSFNTRFKIDINARNQLIATLNPSDVTVDISTTATIGVIVKNDRGNVVPGATVNLIIGNRSLVPPFRRLSPITLPSATTNAAGEVSFTTPVLTTLGSFKYNVTVTHPSYKKSATATGTINVRDPATPDMEINYITPMPVSATVGTPITIEFSVRRLGATPVLPINTATFTLTPMTGITSGPTKVVMSNGRYKLKITPVTSQAGTTETYNLNASALGYNPTSSSFSVNISALSTMSININPPSPISGFATRTTTITASVVDSSTSNPVNIASSDFQVTSSVGASPVPFTKIGTGQFQINFNSPTPSTLTLTLRAKHPLYNDSTNTANLIIKPMLPVTGVLIWAPNPSNKYQLLQIKVCDPINGNPLKNIAVSIIDTHPTNACTIIGTLTTDLSGSFPAQIKLKPIGPVPANEIHNLRITLNTPSFPTLPPITIPMEFRPIGSPLGGVSRRPF